MDFKFSEEDETFRREFRSRLETNLPPDWRGDNELDANSQSEFERSRIRQIQRLAGTSAKPIPRRFAWSHLARFSELAGPNARFALAAGQARRAKQI